MVGTDPLKATEVFRSNESVSRSRPPRRSSSEAEDGNGEDGGSLWAKRGQ